MKQLARILLGVIFVSSVAFSLDEYKTFQAASPDTARSVQPVALIVKGDADNDLYYLEANATTGGIPVTEAPAQKAVIDIHRHDYSSVNVTTGAYVELIASTSANIYNLYIFDSSGETLVFATGAAASEVDLFYITPGGNGEFSVFITSGARLSVKAISANATSGEFVLNATD